MRTLFLFLALLTGNLAAQSPATPSSTVQTDIASALSGDWTGVLEYRDYSEPSTSTKRVQLPTWLSIHNQPEGLRFHYVYDDGPTKTVESTSTVVIDTNARTYKVIGTDHDAEIYSVAGFERLKSGRGELILTGSGKDNDKPSEVRITFTIRRNLISSLEEVRPAGSPDAFVFRHRYTFTRAAAPQVTPAK